ncbi:MAG: hypothetical protein ACYDDV_05420 [Methanoregula sp.]
MVKFTGGGIIIRKWIAIGIIVILTAVAISGCLGVKTPPVSRPATPGIFVDYHRTGGIAGMDDRLVIFDNGVTVISRKTASTEITLNQTDLERITGIFNEAQFSQLGGNYTARHGSADYYRYTISYHSKTVNADESAVPPLLQPVIDEMNRIISATNTGEQVNRPFANLQY